MSKVILETLQRLIFASIHTFMLVENLRIQANKKHKKFIKIQNEQA